MAGLQVLINYALLVQTLKADQDLDSDVHKECLQSLHVSIDIRVWVPFQFGGH